MSERCAIHRLQAEVTLSASTPFPAVQPAYVPINVALGDLLSQGVIDIVPTAENFQVFSLKPFHFSKTKSGHQPHLGFEGFKSLQ